MSAPAGSGKTTLAASWLSVRRRPCLWYQADAGDADPAAFFFYLRQAVEHLGPTRRVRLPLLTPEYALGLPAYARNFFAAMGDRVPAGTVIVLDNYQDLPPDAPLHSLLTPALSGLPEGVRALVLSRSAPPPSFARLVAGDAVGFLDAEELNLTDGETRALARARVGRSLTARDASELRARTGGWMVATVLLLDAPTRALPSRRGAESATQQLLFDYFAAEIFDRAPPDTRKVLLATALLPEVSVASAEELTGEARSAAILSDLVARNFFTLRLAGDEPRYRYHPLFREFLISRMRRSLEGPRWRALAARSAEILAAAGSVEDAAAILMEARDHGTLARLVSDHGPRLFREGRRASLERWIRALPASAVDADPWLAYWAGVCRMAEPPKARASFNAAYLAFRARGDLTASLLAWAGYVSTFFFVWDEFASLDRWISEMDELRRMISAFPSAEVEVQVTGGMIGSLTWRAPAHPEMEHWVSRAIALLGSDVAPDLRMQLASFVVFYRVTWGDYAGARALIERVRPLAAASDVRPLTQMFWYVIEASYEARIGNSRACFEAVERGLETATRTGVLGLNHLLPMQAVYGALAAGDVAAARRYLAMTGQHLGPEQRCDTAHYLHLHAWTELCAGNVSRAEEHARASMEYALQAGPDLGRTWSEYTLAHVLVERGRYAEAASLVESALAWSRPARNVFVEHDCLLALAHVRSAQGRAAEAVELLAQALRLGRERDLVRHPWIGWRREVMARLAALALEHGIEVEHVRAIVRANDLAAPEDAAALDGWPWPMQVRSLGRFELRREGERVVFGRRSPSKPLELLQAIVALGGEGIREGALVDRLWPDAEGDAGQHAIEVTLHRLRKILGSPSIVVQRDRTISLDHTSCWSDVRALQPLLATAFATVARPRADPAPVIRQAERVLGIYRGPLLPALASGWVNESRERLRGQVARFLRTAAERLSACGEKAAAEELVHRGLAADPELPVGRTSVD